MMTFNGKYSSSAVREITFLDQIKIEIDSDSGYLNINFKFLLNLTFQYNY